MDRIYASKTFIIYVVILFIPVWIVQSAFVMCLCTIGSIKGYAITVADIAIIVRIIFGLRWPISRNVCWLYVGLALLLIPITEALASHSELF